MSTILKALRRLEQEKKEEGGRPLREQVAKAPAQGRRWPSWLVAGGALTAGVAVGAAALLLWSGNRPEAPESARGVGADEARLVASAPRAGGEQSLGSAERSSLERVSRARRRERRTEAAREAEADQGRLVVSAQRGAAERSPEARPEAAQRGAAERSPEVRPEAAQRAEGERSLGSAARSQQPASEESAPRPEAEPGELARPQSSPAEVGPSGPPPPSVAARAAGGEAASPQADAGSAGLSPGALASRVEVVDRIEEPPGSEQPEGRTDVAKSPPPVVADRLARAPVPEVFVARTVWHPLPERRVAEVEVKGRPEPLRLHEGDAVGPLVVGRIEPSGVVFLHEQVELRRRVGAR